MSAIHGARPVIGVTLPLTDLGLLESTPQMAPIMT